MKQWQSLLVQRPDYKVAFLTWGLLFETEQLSTEDTDFFYEWFEWILGNMFTFSENTALCLICLGFGLLHKGRWPCPALHLSHKARPVFVAVSCVLSLERRNTFCKVSLQGISVHHKTNVMTHICWFSVFCYWGEIKKVDIVCFMTMDDMSDVIFCGWESISLKSTKKFRLNRW